MNDALNAITLARQAIETLITQTPNTDEYTLAKLGPILAELRTAENTLKE